jgi:choline monooxygenase
VSIDLDDVLPGDTYQRLVNPGAGPSRGLPNAAFTSDDFLALENERLFKRNWVFVAHGRDVPNAGDIKPLDVGGLPLLLVRNVAGEVNVFHNACRHRGRKLVETERKAQRNLVCPYHRWAYDLDGALQATPHFGGFKEHSTIGFDPADFGLLAVRCVEWHHWILVNLDGSAPPFEDYVKPLRERVDNWPFRASGAGLDTLKHVSRIDFGTIEGNWKIVVENFIEPYHVAYVHSESCAGQPLEAHHAYHDGALVGSEVRLDGWRPGGEGAQGKTESLNASALYMVLFPNFALGLYGDSVISILALPDGPSRTREQFDVYVWDYVEPTPELVAGWVDLNKRINAEDISMIEAMQKGLASPAMSGGAVLSPHWESCVKQFETLVLDALR